MAHQLVGESTLAEEIRAIVERALEEDLGPGDVTTDAAVPPHAHVRGRFIAKAPGVVAGWDVAAVTFRVLDPRVKLVPVVSDGTAVQPGRVIGSVAGPACAILTGERVALNFLQRMSGIATLTRAFVDAVRGTGATILDTRKTMPGLRVLDRLAVVLGGGTNHRFGLFDMALIKENHIAAAGGIAAAVRRIRALAPEGLPVEVEVRTLDELREALELAVDRILLDNMDLETMRQAVRLAGGRVPLEASGGVSLDTVAEIARTGVTYISVGALTHSVRAMDISLLLET